MQLQRRHVLGAETRQLLDLNTRELLESDTFNTLYGHQLQRPLPFTAFRNSKVSPRVLTFDYHPGRHELIMLHPNGSKVGNLWRDGGVEPAVGDCSTILSHFEYLVPAASERDHLMDVFAHLVRRTGVKIGHMVIIQGRQGTGKSWIAECLNRLLGPLNVKVAESEQLHSRFRASLLNTEALVIEELMHAGRLELYNSLKQWIVNDLVKVEEKGIPFHSARTPQLMIAFSNHDVPIYLEPDDRRAFVIASPVLPKDKAYYHYLHNEVLEMEVAAFKQWLLTRDLAGFNAKEPPPMTDGKVAIIKESRPPLVRELLEKIEERHLVRDMVTAAEVQLALTTFPFGKRPSMSDVTKALRAAGAIHINRQIKVDDNPIRLWIIRNHEKWLQADPTAIGGYIRDN